MNDTSAGNQVEQQFAIAVTNYVPRASRKYQQLLTLKTGIAELRHKGASYKTIAELLRNSGITVSRMTVARFCLQVLQPRKATVTTSPQERHSASHTSLVGDHSVERKRHPGGPRIANPNDI